MSRRYITSSPAAAVEEEEEEVDEVDGELPLASLPLHASSASIFPELVGDGRKDIEITYSTCF